MTKGKAGGCSTKADRRLNSQSPTRSRIFRFGGDHSRQDINGFTMAIGAPPMSKNIVRYSFPCKAPNPPEFFRFWTRSTEFHTHGAQIRRLPRPLSLLAGVLYP